MAAIFHVITGGAAGPADEGLRGSRLRDVALCGGLLAEGPVPTLSSPKCPKPRGPNSLRKPGVRQDAREAWQRQKEAAARRFPTAKAFAREGRMSTVSFGGQLILGVLLQSRSDTNDPKTPRLSPEAKGFGHVDKVLGQERVARSETAESALQTLAR